MSRDGMSNYLSLNRSLMDVGGEIRQLRLPRMNPFPKLDSTSVRSRDHSQQPAASRPVVRGAVIIGGDVGQLPEMTTDVMGTDAGYAVENVKRERSPSRSWSRMGFGHLVGRMLGSHRAAHP